MGEFSLVLRTDTCLNHCQEPDEFIVEYRGSVRYLRPRDDRVFGVGRVRAYRVYAALAARADERLFDVYDAFSQQMRELYEKLYETKTALLRGEVRERFDVGESPDLLVIDAVLLHPRWRGLKMGPLIVRRLIELLGSGCGLVLSDVRPLRGQACEALGAPAAWAPAGCDDAQTKLEQYFARQGFRQLRGTNLFGMPLEVDA